jgi:hypothetical protein
MANRNCLTKPLPMNDTNVSLPLQGSLLRDTQKLAQELNISWPRLIVLALQEFVRRNKARAQLLELLNASYESDDADVLLLQQMKSSHRKLVEGEW